MSKTDCVNCGAPIGPVVGTCPYCDTEYEPIHTYTTAPFSATEDVVRGWAVRMEGCEIVGEQPALIWLRPWEALA